MPRPALPETTLRSAGVAPPICVSVAPTSSEIPFPPFGRAEVPAGVVPIKLPCTTLALTRLVWKLPKLMPLVVLPDTRLINTRLLEPETPMPLPFGIAVVPAAFVPM